MSAETLTAAEAPPYRPPVAATPTVLIVDDSPVDRLVAGRLIAQQAGWQVAYAGDGADALEAIARNPPQVVLTDLQMPRVNGLTLVRRVREQHPRVPVVLMTGHGSEEVAIMALRAGAASYVPKRALPTALIPALEQVLSASQTDEHRSRVLACLTRRASRFVLENDPTLVPPLVALFREDLLATGVCDPTGATRAGIALEEALLNAIYHGNLEISSDLKKESDTAFRQTAAERRWQAPYRDRRVQVGVSLTAEWARYVIADEGPGFDVSALPDPTDPANLGRPSGRGVLLMRTFMDRVTYNSTGNRVIMVKQKDGSAADRYDDDD